jgi:hypothetical protein
MNTDATPPAGALNAGIPVQTRSLRYEIEWHYTPADLFVDPFTEHVLDCDLQMGDGTALATIRTEVYEKTPSLQQQLHRFVDARLKVQQFKTARAYQLDNGSLTEFHHDGKRTLHLSAFANAKISVFSADIKITDSTGRTIFDSSAERARARLKYEQKRCDLETLDNQLTADIEQYYRKQTRLEESIVSSLLSSYLASCNDPENELVHLYEIRDAVKKRFGGEIPARQALGVSKAEWSEFGRLADNEPLVQGRHRGNFSGQLRPATDEELVVGRLFAKRLLRSFLHYVDQPKSTT